ncbi:MAG: hypothetical protein JKY44_01585 [Flavobacteriaceae bacterium]|nr:hypothetical protein [Flavobacteriaceae bacterium]
MKKILLLSLLLFSSILIAQRQNAQKRQNFDASKVVGIFYYEEVKAIKRIKIKEKELKYSVKKAIISYNSKIKEISFLKNAELKGVTDLVNATKIGSNRGVLGDFRTRVSKVLSPIRDSIKGFEKRLNANLKEQLSKKQFKNWLKFQKRTKRELEPKAPEVQRRNAPPRRRNTRQRRRY